MREVKYVDSLGRRFKVSLPDDLSDDDAKHGIIIGPPILDGLGLPVQLEVELHNQLYERGIFTLREAKARRSELVSALQRVLAIDADKILEAF